MNTRSIRCERFKREIVSPWRCSSARLDSLTTVDCKMTLNAKRIIITLSALMAIVAPLIPLHQRDDMRIVVHQCVVVAVWGVLFLTVGRHRQSTEI